MYSLPAFPALENVLHIDYFTCMTESDSQFEDLDPAKVEANLQRLSNGAVLLARDALKDPNFDATLILLCVYNKDGAYGLVLNRPSHMPLSEIFDGFSGLHMKREVFIGGPVQQEELQLVQITSNPVADAFEIVPGLFMGGKWESIQQMIEADQDTTRLFLGYSGWAPEQLETEIRAGAWDVYQVDIIRLFSDAVEKIIADEKQITAYLKSIERQ